MFKAEVYKNRRDTLKAKIDSGIALFMGNVDSPMNYQANTFHFRQDSNFLYFFGIDLPGLAGIIDFDEGTDILFGDDVEIDDIIWMGPQPSMKDYAAKVAIENVQTMKDLSSFLQKAMSSGRPIHFLPPYRGETNIQLESLYSFINSCHRHT